MQKICSFHKFILRIYYIYMYIYIYIYMYITNFLFWILWTCLAFPSKTIMPTFRNFDVYLHAKKELHSYFFFEILQRFANLLLWVLSESLIMFINNEVSPFIKIWCPKCWNKLVGHFVHLHAKNQLRHSLLF